MNQNLQKISEFLQTDLSLSAEEKASLTKAVADADKELEITAFKLERTEKVKRTTAILLEETIEELEHKRKAVEAQNRELEIEASLERVRSNAMAMRSSDELNTIIGKVFTECIKLDIQLDRGMIMIFDPDSLDSWWWMANPEAPDLPRNYHIPYHVYKPYLEYLDGWKERTVRWTYELEGKEKKDWDAHIFVNSELSLPPIEVKQVMMGFPKVYLNASFNNFGGLTLASIDPMTDEHFDILLRFAKVFDLTYTRFNDLKQAEAQAREAQIEVALERVRARAMAMHSSGELKEVVHELRKQMGFLGQKDMDTCVIHLHDESPDFINAWAAIQPPESKDEIIESTARVPKKGLLIIEEALEAYSSNQQDYVIINEGVKIRQWFNFIQKESPEAFNKIEESAESTNAADPISYWSFSDFPGGSLLMVTIHQPTVTSRNLLRRFANVFGLAYRRFADLKQAEAQAREAKIEAALERIRSRSMAMSKTDELTEIIGTIFTELSSLDVALLRCVIAIYNSETYDQRWWMANAEDAKKPVSFFIKYIDLPPNKAFVDAWKMKLHKWVYLMKGDIKREWDRRMLSETELSLLPESVKTGMRNPAPTYCNTAFNNYGCLTFVSPEALMDDQFDILIRFANVFDQTYTRFNDLKQVEAQARESQIQLALERVRARTMAMQRSDELQDAALILFQQIQALGVPPFACGFNIWDEDQKAATAWMGSVGGLQPPFKTDSSRDVYLPIYEAAQRGESLFVTEQSGKELEVHYDYLATIPIFNDLIIEDWKRKGIPVPTFQIIHCAYFTQGYLMFISFEPVPSYYEIFKRFAKVFEQTYTRFLDLQRAEEQAREAVKQSSLDRVRGQIASMRTTTDLERITPIIWHELISLDVPFIRCGVFIINEERSNIQVFLSAPDGHSLAAMDLPFDSSELTINSVNHWRKGLIYKEHWNKQEFVNFMQSMISEGQVLNTETYQGASKPPESLDLHFVPFAQGMLYVGNIHPLTRDELDLVKSLAEAFSIAYARYEDFKKLEIAKQSIETTLSELKAAQSQLVQSEKMASLGELTAGIAHEIQNPLNFVNNFSEVSSELLVEMKDELTAGNWQLAIEIADDVKHNLEKINHHGKRAADIVKGMLQHSRNSSGVKEPTNINTLADEYLRLAYHGLRAKDKSFNATMKTDFDETIGNINIIPQDIGRVILNLITNAFYAVQTRVETRHALSLQQSTQQSDFEPTVNVSTKNMGSRIEIKVKDNGTGIPAHILDKIFQPFFTTKPTGQGTGLGLSLAYDIVKAHGGELRVETKEGEGSEFIMQLPINTRS